MAFIIVSLILSVGAWFLRNKLSIPPERIEAAHWVLVCSALSFGFGLISVSYNALIIAHERMKAYAYISILSVFLKLGAVLLLTVTAYDSLKAYAVYLLGVSLITQACYWTYCRSQFKESRFNFVWDKELLKHMFGFSGWAFASYAVGMLNIQGVNILTNIYFGVTLNAARGIASQVEGALKQFIGNLTVSVNPQITKSYAIDDKNYMFQLICGGSKFAYFLALLFVIPLFIEAETVLTLWLENVPEYATVFVRLTLLTMLPQVLGGILFTAAMATGNIRNYSIIINGVSILTFIFAWLLFWLGFPAEVAYLVHLFIRIILVVLRVFLLKSMISFSPSLYFKSVFIRIMPVSLLAFLVPLLVLFVPIPQSFLRVVLVTLVSVPVTLLVVYCLGLTKDERSFAIGKLKQLKTRFYKG
ncbi:hypothetical protein HVA01_32290 [Halovibrio variabilis]|uniref:Lipopolysaccharide biosynthesis protein n=1 Tax=Halovibrio variabilis TaxID=31910 RepID=A0A511UVV7_9GAMM|nr:hypothetical protein HVA01_32290 [Halovibrio variabilis]